MENNYRYQDPDFKYTNSNGVLHNLADIAEERILLVYESLKVSRRVEELLENPFKIKDSNTLLEIHHYLFQDVYVWAGKVRTVNPTQEDTSSGAKIICRRNTIPTDIFRRF